MFFPRRESAEAAHNEVTLTFTLALLVFPSVVIENGVGVSKTQAATEL